MAWAARVSGAAAFGIAVWAFLAWPAGCASTGATICPGFALDEPWILRGERSGAALLGMLFLVLVVYRLILQGRLPDRVGRNGPEWSEAAEESKRGIAGLEKAVKEHAAGIRLITESVGRSLAEQGRRIDGLAERVARLDPEERIECDR